MWESEVMFFSPTPVGFVCSLRLFVRSLQTRSNHRASPTLSSWTPWAYVFAHFELKHGHPASPSHSPVNKSFVDRHSNRFGQLFQHRNILNVLKWRVWTHQPNPSLQPISVINIKNKMHETFFSSIWHAWNVLSLSAVLQLRLRPPCSIWCVCAFLCRRTWTVLQMSLQPKSAGWL